MEYDDELAMKVMQYRLTFNGYDADHMMGCCAAKIMKNYNLTHDEVETLMYSNTVRDIVQHIKNGLVI